MTKKILSFLMAAVILAGVFTACSSDKKDISENYTLLTQATTEITKDTTSFKLSYSQSDSLDPFKSETLNNQIVQDLVFDSLFTIDESYEVQPSIAGSYSYTDIRTLVVTLKGGIRFSNSDRVEASDVVSSFNRAKNSPHWKNALAPISSAKAVSDTGVQFNLGYPNPNAHKLLTFAVASKKTDKKGYPIGSGRYKFDDGDGEVFVTVNENYEGFEPHFTKITLVNITSEESIENAINISNISYAYRDLSNGDKVRINCNKKAVNLNNLVFLGINTFAGITKDENIRQAISLAIDREVLVKSSYQGYAKSAVSVFNSASLLGKQTKVFSASADPAAARQSAAKSNIASSNMKIDILTNQNENRVAAARLIKQQLEAAGFSVTINIEKNKAYHSSIKNRRYDIYIGEIKIPNDMNLNCFFAKGGAASDGIDLKKSKSAKAYADYLSGEKEIGRFILEFSQELPFIPVLYRQGMICYSKSIHGDMQGYAGNYFSNIQDWYCN